MIKTSPEYKATIKGEYRIFHARANMILKDGTTLTLTDHDFLTMAISTGTSSTDSFDIGGCVIGDAQFSLNNFDGKFNAYDFYKATVSIDIGLSLSDDSIEWLHKGLFTVDEATGNRAISITAYDNISKLDKDWTTSLTFPTTIGNIIDEICTTCGVSLVISDYDNKDYEISRPVEKITCRQALAWCAQIMCKYVYCDANGRIGFGWYAIQENRLDGGNLKDYEQPDTVDGGNALFTETDTLSGGETLDLERYHHISTVFSSDISTDDVVITGITVKAHGTTSDYGETYTYGSAGYVLSLENNEFIQENKAETVATYIGLRTVGITIRPMDISCQSDPSIEAGDMAMVSTRDATYDIYVTNTMFGINEPQSIECNAETPVRHEKKKTSDIERAVALANQDTEAKLSNYDTMMQNFNTLIAQGFGLYDISETQPDGSIKYYLGDKSTKAECTVLWTMTSTGLMISNNGGTTWAVDANGNMLVNVLYAKKIVADCIEGGTLTMGGLNNGNGVITVNDAVGNTVATISNAGINVTSGRIGNWNLKSTGLECVKLISDYVYATGINNPDNDYELSKLFYIRKSDLLGTTYEFPWYVQRNGYMFCEKGGLGSGGFIGAWKVDELSLYTDSSLEAGEGYTYRTYIQQATNGDTWVFSAQKSSGMGPGQTEFNATWKVTADGAEYVTSVYVKNNLSCDTLTQRSLEEYKYDISELTSFTNSEGIEISASDIVKDSSIYSYKLKNEQEENIYNVNYGFVIGADYNTPYEVLCNDGKGINLYSMSALNWKALQEQIVRNEALEKTVSEQADLIASLSERLDKLENKESEVTEDVD